MANPMTAYEIPGLRFSLPAGAVCARYRFVTVNSDGMGVPADADSIVIGTSMNEISTDNGWALDDQVLEIADGITIVEAAGVIATGSGVVAGEDGCAEAAGEGDVAIGVALTPAAAAGEFITVKYC